MAVKGYTRNFTPLRILSEEQIEQIHTSTLEVLKKTGVRFDSERALKLFKKNGCTVDYSNNRVRFPEALVEESLRMCPSRFLVKARNSKMIWSGEGIPRIFKPYPARGLLILILGAPEHLPGKSIMMELLFLMH